MENKDNFVQGLMIGGVVGVVIGLMMAPDSGEKTRKELIKKFHELKDTMGDRFDQWQTGEKKEIKAKPKKTNSLKKTIAKTVGQKSKLGSKKKK